MFKRKLAAFSCLFSAAVFICCLFGFSFRLPFSIQTELSEVLEYLPNKASEFVKHAITTLYSGQSSVFMQSLLLGDKTDFYSDFALKTAMSRAGIMHVIAVSGMHICFVIDSIRRVFGNSRRSALIILPLIWFFVLMTGASPSAVRAGFMQSMAVTAMLFKRENDAFTTLSFSLAVILLLSPDSCTSVSLQLSFASVAGMMLFSDRISDYLRKKIPSVNKSKILSYLSDSIASSVSVMILTVPLTAYHFGSIQILSPISNIFILPAVSVCFCAGYISVLLLPFLPLFAGVPAFIAQIACSYITFISGLIAKIPFASLYLSNRLNLAWVISVYVVLFICFLLYRFRLRSRSGLLVIFVCAYAVVSLVTVITETRHYYQMIPGCFTAVDVGQGQSLVVISGDKTVVIDCGSSNSNIDAGQRTGEYLLSCGRKKINLLLLTHLHSDHVSGIRSLFEYIDVDEIVVSKDASADEDQLIEICLTAENHGTRVTYLVSDSETNIDDINMKLYAPPFSFSSDENESCICALVSIGDDSMLVTADSPREYEERLCAMHDFTGTDVLIVGHHGSKYAASETLLNELGPVTSVISVGVNRYSHPSDETIKKLLEHGCTVYRTDINGSVELILGD